jgi:hypothetical protein
MPPTIIKLKPLLVKRNFPKNSFPTLLIDPLKSLVGNLLRQT